MEIYPEDRPIHLLNNWGKKFSWKNSHMFSAIRLCRGLRSAPDRGIVSIHIKVDFQCRESLSAYLRKIYVRK